MRDLFDNWELRLQLFKNLNIQIWITCNYTDILQVRKNDNRTNFILFFFQHPFIFIICLYIISSLGNLISSLRLKQYILVFNMKKKIFTQSFLLLLCAIKQLFISERKKDSNLKIKIVMFLYKANMKSKTSCLYCKKLAYLLFCMISETICL